MTPDEQRAYNREAKRRSRAAHPGRDAAAQRRRYALHPEQAGEWQKKHREEINARRRAARAAESQEQRESRLAAQRRYQYPEKDRAYREAHRSERATYATKRWQSMTVEERRRASSESWRRTGRLKRYGVTAESFAAMLAQQGDACAVCRRPFDDTVRALRPHLDHDHATGVPRGVLCLNCNALLGNARDSEDVLRAAVAYLAKEARDN